MAVTPPSDALTPPHLKPYPLSGQCVPDGIRSVSGFVPFTAYHNSIRALFAPLAAVSCAPTLPGACLTMA